MLLVRGLGRSKVWGCVGTCARVCPIGALYIQLMRGGIWEQERGHRPPTCQLHFLFPYPTNQNLIGFDWMPVGGDFYLPFWHILTPRTFASHKPCLVMGNVGKASASRFNSYASTASPFAK
jgi:hypothetical protein